MQTVQAISFLREYQTNSCPIQLVCVEKNEGVSNYFVKFPSKGQPHDLLIYELIFTEIAKRVGVMVPQTALVSVSEEVLKASKLRRNAHVSPDQVGLGSREVTHSTMVSLMFSKINKRIFAAFRNPLDLLTIALMDLHLDNRDRREQNFNLLITHGRKRDIVAIDHLACFGGEAHIGRPFSINAVNENLSVLLSGFAKQLLSFVDNESIFKRVEDYFCTVDNECISDVLRDVREQLPNRWNYSAGLFDRIESFLSDSERNKVVRDRFELLLHRGILTR